MAKKNKWEQPSNPPPPLFTGKKERDLVKKINDEIIERVIGSYDGRALEELITS